MTVRVLLLLLVCVGCATSSTLPLRFVSGDGPAYPEAARAAGVEGFVVVVYDVGVDGTVSNARVVTSSPPGVFDAAALAAVSAWRFYAPVVEGQPQSAPNRESRLDFTLGSGDEYDR